MESFALFETPLFVFRLDGLRDVNGELSARLIEEADTTLGIQRSNQGGWHSSPDLALREAACFQRLFSLTLGAVGETFRTVARARGVTRAAEHRYSIQAWSMVMRDGDYVTLHDHAEAHFSTVYYPDAGDSPGESGGITFVDGRRNSTVIPGMAFDPTEFALRPETGMLVVFPGWLQHYVHPYRGERPRVSIASNLRIELAAADR